MHIISPQTFDIIRKADEGCIESQMTIGIYYLGSDELPDDPQMASHYLSRFFHVPYEIVRAKNLLSRKNYLQALIHCGHSYSLLGDYKSALIYYVNAHEFADAEIPKENHKALFDNLDFIEARNLIESYIDSGYENSETNLSYNA